MGCGCLVALFAAISPRLAIFAVWLFSDRMSVVYDSFWLPFIGFLFLPWTTLAYAAVWEPGGPTGLGVALVVFAFVIDLMSFFGAGRSRTYYYAQQNQPPTGGYPPATPPPPAY